MAAALRPGLAFAGDLHASRFIYTGLPGMRGDSRYALEQIVDVCRRRELDLIFLGDTFDARFPEPDVVGEVLHLIADIDVAYIVGQHDQHNYGWLDVHPSDRLRRRLRPGERWTMAGINISGFDFAPRTALLENLARVPRGTEILCLHQMLTDVAPMGNGQLSAAELPDYVSITALGDWHGMPQAGEHDGRRWFYTGSMTMRSYNEPPDKTFVVVTRDSGGSLQVERVPLNSRPLVRGDLFDVDDLSAWLSTAKSAIQESRDSAIGRGMPADVAVPLVAVRYNAEIDGAHSRLMETLQPLSDSGEAFVHLVINRKFAPAQTIDCASTQASLVSVDDVIDGAVDRRISPELHGLVTELAYTPEPDAVVAAYKRRHGVDNDPLRV